MPRANPHPLSFATLLLLVTLAAVCAGLAGAQQARAAAASSPAAAEQQFAASLKKLTGKFTCTACVIGVTIIDNAILDHETDILSVLNKLCDELPKQTERSMCHTFVDLFGAKIIEALLRKESASKICNSIKAFECKGCSLDTPQSWQVFRQKSLSEQRTQNSARITTLAVLARMAWLKASQSTPSNQDVVIPDPKFDLDGDFSSFWHTVPRGADWRGRDCNDNNAAVLPGLASDDATDPKVDKNCNGISGFNQTFGKTNEELFCAGSEGRQVVMFGDSASSGFHIPGEWFHLANLTKILSALDEADYPQLSWSTGYDQSIGGQSIYMRMRERNLCNHRAYVNVGHNGHRAAHLGSLQVPAVRLGADMKPILGFVAYIGNDACHDPAISVAEFTSDMRRGLQQLDAKVPAGSKVLLMGLVDGRILFNTMSKRVHPLGCTYDTLYDFLECSGADVCNNWLTRNATRRDETSARAKQYSDVLKSYADNPQQLQLKNIELSYVDFPLEAMVQYCHEHGLDPAMLIEAVDGFHPSHFAHRIVAQYVWNLLETKLPHWIGPVNVRNDQIRLVFGAQGGH